MKHWTERIITLSQLACVVTLGALLAASWHHYDAFLDSIFVVSLVVFALAAGAIASRTRRVPRIFFAGFAIASSLLVIIELVGFALPGSIVGQAVHTVSATDKAILVATLNALLPLYAHAVLAARERLAESLETTVMAERTLSSTLETQVAMRTADLEDTERVLQRMWRLGQQISLELDPTRVLERFVDAASDIAQADGAAIGLLDEGGTMRVPIARGALVELAGVQLPAAGTALSMVLQTGTRWVTDDAAAESASARATISRVMRTGARSVAVLPISRRGERIGAVALVRQSVNPFSEAALARVTAMTDLLNVALENAELVETLRRAEWRFRTLFRSAPDGVFTVLRSGRVHEANNAASDIIGIDPLRMVGRRLSDLVVDEDRERLDEALSATFEARSARLEVTFRREPGATAHVVSLAASLLPEADPPSILVVARDVTSEREMRARLMESDRLAAVGELVAGVAHEVNNPLSSISAYAQLLLRDPAIEGVQREQVEVIRSETTRASHVVKDLLSFARRSEPRYEPLNLNLLVARTLRIRAFELSSRMVTVRQSLEAELPAVVGDARQLQQVCLNLITNATQAMAPRGGVLGITTRRAGDGVVLEVSDTGTGIPSEARARIFDPFFTTKGEGEGTGLGLSVSYGIVTAHHGKIEIAATSTEGTTFRVSLPAATTAVSASLPIDAPPREMQAAIAGIRVLVVDDEPAILSGITAYAHARRFTVVTAQSAEAALAVLADTSVDAVVCDIHLPGMDGFALHQWLHRERPGLADRTVFITGDVVSLSRRATGRQPMLAKPFSFERLEASLAAVMQGRPFDGSQPTPIRGVEIIP